MIKLSTIRQLSLASEGSVLTLPSAAAMLGLGHRLHLGLGVLVSGLVGALLVGAIAQAEPVTPNVGGIRSTATADPLLGDGVYFYGQAPTPEQLGAGYMVFESQGDRVIGAIYMPLSSFDCFQGRLSGGNLALQITNSYSQETYGYDVAIATSPAIASENGVAIPLSLQGFHNLGAAGESELGLLQTCKGVLSPNQGPQI
ncbi:hypothetical protein [Leptolyngbya sp. PCC 6406]|uniref:hypothetical protein n=1 Tax=Leptolyngbya sp. PCC 6406 TaxID=1173264 RepID=UPI0002AC27C5|nr:hypothetical protein [Leptolyngbya sp. PCC 6406]